MNILLSKNALKAISSYDAPTRQRLNKAIAELPYGDVKVLNGTTAKRYRKRVGNLRILFTKPDKYTIYISDILSRGQAYNRI